MNNIEDYTQEIMQLIGKGQLKEAIVAAQDLLKGSPQFYEIMLQSARYSDTMKSVHLGLIDFQTEKIEKNKITYALMEMLQTLEEKTANTPKIQTEIQQYLKEKEATTANTAAITGDGNFNLQGITSSQINIQIGNKKNQ